MKMKSISENDARELRSFIRHCKNHVFNEIYGFYAHINEQDGVKQRAIADRIAMDYGQLSKLLRAPSNMTIEKVATVLWGMHAEMEFKAVAAGTEQSMDEFMRLDDERPTSWEAFRNAKVVTLDDWRDPSQPDPITIGSFDAEEEIEAATG